MEMEAVLKALGRNLPAESIGHRRIKHAVERIDRLVQ